ncbi:MAG: ADP-ribosylglycohydrolase family protein [Candidatus Coproplasma sp.]
MIGAIIGDIVGSRFEFIDHYGKDFPLFVRGCRFTDDSLMTIAVAKALYLSKGDYKNLGRLTAKIMKDIAKPYPDIGWGGNFYRWLFEGGTFINSYGNGAGMRVSPVGWVAESEEEVKLLSQKVTEISHNHYLGLKGAEAVAMGVYLARIGKDKRYIRERLGAYYPVLNDKNFSIKSLMGNYGYDIAGHWVTCEGSIPQAIVAFLDGEDFEDVIRNAVGIGGDSDTIGAMAGSIAEAYYGVPPELEEKALSYLPDDLKGLCYAFETIKKKRVER